MAGANVNSDALEAAFWGFGIVPGVASVALPVALYLALESVGASAAGAREAPSVLRGVRIRAASLRVSKRALCWAVAPAAGSLRPRAPPAGAPARARRVAAVSAIAVKRAARRGRGGRRAATAGWGWALGGAMSRRAAGALGRSLRLLLLAGRGGGARDKHRVARIGTGRRRWVWKGRSGRGGCQSGGANKR